MKIRTLKSIALTAPAWALGGFMLVNVAGGQSPPIQGDTPSSSNAPSEVEARVRESFAMQTKLQAKRIELAEEKLAQIKRRHQERIENAEELIARQIAMLTGDGPTTPGSPKVEGIPLPPMVDVPASALAAEGWQLWRQRKLPDALGKFKASVAKDQTDANAYNGLGWTLLNLGEAKDAMEAFRKALKLEPTHGAALNGVGQSFVALGELEAAEAELINATQSVIAQLGEETVVRQGITASWVSLVRVAIELKHWDVARDWASRYLQHKADDAVMKSYIEQINTADPKEKS